MAFVLTRTHSVLLILILPYSIVTSFSRVRTVVMNVGMVMIGRSFSMFEISLMRARKGGHPALAR